MKLSQLKEWVTGGYLAFTIRDKTKVDDIVIDNVFIEDADAHKRQKFLKQKVDYGTDVCIQNTYGPHIVVFTIPRSMHAYDVCMMAYMKNKSRLIMRVKQLMDDGELDSEFKSIADMMDHLEIVKIE